MDYLLVLIAGLFVGSFLNICIYSIPRGDSIAFPSIHCTLCGERLTVPELVPVLGYLILRGKCRYCKGKKPLNYPMVELLTAMLFILLYHRFSLSFIFLKYTLLSALLIVIAFIDFSTQEIPESLLLVGAATTLLFIGADPSVPAISAVIGAAAGFGLFLAIALISNAMGGGDIKLMALIGFAVGFPNVLSVILLSFIIGAVVSLFLLVSGVKDRKDFVPFAPFIFTAFVFVILWSSDFLNL